MSRSLGDDILTRALSAPSVGSALTALAEGGISVRGLAGSSVALFLAAASLREKTLLTVASDAEEADALRDDLAFFLGEERVLHFPDRDLPPYSPQRVRPAVEAARLEALTRLAGADAGSDGRLRAAAPVVIVTTAAAAAMRVPAPERLRRSIVTLHVGETLDLDGLLSRLAYLGYEPAVMVGEPGEMSHRGGIVDIFTYGYEEPLRVELEGETVSSLRTFDPMTQRSSRRLDEARILPARELLLEPDSLPGELFYEGIEWAAAAFESDRVTIAEYLPEDAAVALVAPAAIARGADEALDEAAGRYHEAQSALRAASPPEALFLSGDALLEALARRRVVAVSPAGEPGAGERARLSLRSEHAFTTRPQEHFGRNIDLLREHLAQAEARGLRVVILCDTDAHRDHLLQLIPGFGGELDVGALSAGFTFPDLDLALLTDHEIFLRPRRRRRLRRFKRGLLPSELRALKPGDYVVHIDHGIGVYRGMRRITVNGQLTDCLALEYASKDALFIPADQLDRVQRYAAEEGKVPQVSRLGGTAWAKKKARAKKAIRDMAEELIKAYAERKASPGHAFPADTIWQHELESSFPYDETPDQLRAVEETKEDMESAKPMDRLICGDVGYGKTEVAIRTAFKAVMDGKQVAVLVPTTLLAQQHLTTFRERLEGLPVRVEMLSRFRTTAEQKKVVEETKKGLVDIVLGTHRLLSKDVGFKNLGLVIIDEEQRFGVAHKERIRGMRKTVDVLAMTATPIPRTLHLSLLGARDISIINTPPRDRRPIRTEICEFNDDVITEALLKEADRGGQSFFIHNRVESIYAAAARVQKLVPQLRLGIAHGQMHERDLERVMLEFLDRQYDVLVTTLIIESGIDIPSANTMILDRADTFGLAQLYQLRGRVGRSNVQAHAYLLVPERRVLTEEAEKRLRAIEEFEELGSAFQIAMRDLEIRGAGNILGAEQHGHIVDVGFDLYMRLLDEAVHEMKGEIVEEKPEPKIITDVEAYLPETYVRDEVEKVSFYKRLAATKALAEVHELEAEITDRFGRLPHPARNLFDLRRVRLMAAAFGAEALTVRRGLVQVELGRPLTRAEVQDLVKRLDFAVEFITSGRHGLRVVRLPDDPVTTAKRLLGTARPVRVG